MPGLTGLDLIKELHDILPEIKIIILSGYSDFEYAKTAMAYGITNYILKPVDENEISQVLLKVKESIINERKQYEENNLIKEQYAKTMSVLLEKFLNQLISPNCLTLDYIKNELKKLGLSFDNGFFTTVVFKADKTIRGNGNKLKKYKTIISRIMKRYLGAVTFTNLSKDIELISIVNGPQNIDQDSMNRAFKLCTALYNKHFEGQLSLGVSMTAQQVTRLPDMYIQSTEALQLKFWEDSGNIFYYKPTSYSDTVNINISEEVLDDITVNVKISECNPAFSYLDSVCSQLKAHPPLRPELVKDFFWTFIQSITNRLGIQLSFIEQELTRGGIHPYEIIKGCDSLNELLLYIRNIFERICVYYNRNNHSEDMNVIEMAKKFIESNFDKNLSLEQVSRYVHLNPTYFSELFKKNTGMSFVDYKTFLRIENAKKLLTTTGLNVEKISSSLGYTDPKYFSKLFKKITGKTPQDYKKKNSPRL
jgi:two-component system response regulator YesN